MDGRMKAQLVAVAGPLVVLLAVRVLLSPSTVTAGAVQQVSQPMPVTAPVAKLSPEQQTVIEWCAAQDAGGIVSPFVRELFPRPIVAEPAQGGGEPEIAPEQPPPQGSPAAGLRLSAVMSTSEGGVAIISGKMYKPGQEVRAGVRLTRIDARTSRVELTDAQGQVWRLSCER